MNLKTLAVLIVITNGLLASAQIYDTNGAVVQTFAGSGFSGYVDGVGQLTMFNNPSAIVADLHGNLFVWDGGNSRIRKITPDGTVSTLAGGGTQSNGIGTNATFDSTSFVQMTIDRINTLWMVGLNFDSDYVELIQIKSDGTVTKTNLWRLGDNIMTGICADSFGNIYISGNNKIYQFDTNSTLTVFAGSGNSGNADGNGIFTAFKMPGALCADAANNIYASDWGNGRIRKIDQCKNVTTLSVFASVTQMCFDDSGSLIFTCADYIKKLSALTNIVMLAGSSTESGYANGVGNLALFYYPVGLCFSRGLVFVSDQGNNRIRQISFNPQPQVVSGANLGIGTFAGVTITGSVGRTYQIQSSPDLNAWTTRATVLLNSSPYLWIDQNPIAGNKFYQAVMLP